MSIVRASEAGIMKSKGRTRGLIPAAGTAAAARFTHQRTRHYLDLAKKLLRASPETIRESRAQFVPAHRRIQGPRGRTARGKSFPISPGKYVNVPAGTREVTGHRAFPDFGLLPSITAGAQVRLATGTDRFGKKQALVDIKILKADLNRLLAIAGIPYIGARFVVWHVGRWSLMEIVYKTPVDTGTAAGGWAISPQLRGKQGYGRVGFRIKNPVPYAIFLEYGHSRKAPQGMMASTFLQARSELRNLMDVMITWWKGQQVLLRNMRFDTELGIGRRFDPAETERKIPKLTWRRLMVELRARLPLDKPVGHLNANVYLAMQIDDPKDWHTVGELPENNYIFETHLVRRTKEMKQVNEFTLPDVTRTVSSRLETTHNIEHVVTQADLPLTVDDVAARAAELQRKWRGGK